jgi:hypothetical protein
LNTGTVLQETGACRIISGEIRNEAVIPPDGGLQAGNRMPGHVSFDKGRARIQRFPCDTRCHPHMKISAKGGGL